MLNKRCGWPAPSPRWAAGWGERNVEPVVSVLRLPHSSQIEAGFAASQQLLSVALTLTLSPTGRGDYTEIAALQRSGHGCRARAFAPEGTGVQA